MENAQKTANAPVEFEQNLQKYIRTAAGLSMSYSKLDADQRLGVTHAVVGLLFIILGISFFFQSLLLSLGNGLVIYGLIEIMGAEAFLNFVKPGDNGTSNYGVFLLGLALILIMNGWGMIGFILELYGLYRTLRERCNHSELTELMSVAQNMIVQRLKYLPFLKSFTREGIELVINDQLESPQKPVKDGPDQNKQVRSDGETIEPIGDMRTQLKQNGEATTAEAQNNSVSDQITCHDADHAKEDSKQENTAEVPLPSLSGDDTKRRAGKQVPEEDPSVNGLPVPEIETTSAQQHARSDKADAFAKPSTKALHVESDHKNSDKATEDKVDENGAKNDDDALVHLTTPEVSDEREAKSAQKSSVEGTTEEAHTMQQKTTETPEPDGHQCEDKSHNGHAS